MGYNQQRVAEDIKRELTILFRTLKDPRISGMLSIVKIDLSGDGSACKVYVSAFEGLKVSKVSARGLTAAAGFIRHEIAKHVKLRVIPYFEFIADDSIEYSAQISQKLKDLNIGGSEPKDDLSDDDDDDDEDDFDEDAEDEDLSELDEELFEEQETHGTPSPDDEEAEDPEKA